MSFGSTVLRGAIFLAAGLAIAWIVFYDPSSLQTAANALFGSFIKNPEQRVYSLAALIVSLLLAVTYFAEKSIGEDQHPMVRL